MKLRLSSVAPGTVTLGLFTLLAASCGGSAEDTSGGASDPNAGDGDGDEMGGPGNGDGDGDNTGGTGDGDGAGGSGDGDGAGGSGDGDGDGTGGTGDGDGDAPVACGSDLDCKSLNLLCEPVSHSCVECVTAGDCDGLATCDAGVCEAIEECENSLDCSGALVCDQDEEICYPCVEDGDCSGGKECIEHACETTCTTPQECSGSSVCDTEAGICTGCLEHSDCSEDEYCSEGECKADICDPASEICVDTSVAECNDVGNSWIFTECVTSCSDDGGAAECVGGEIDNCQFTIDRFDDGDGRICEGFGREGRWFHWENTDPVVPVAGEGRTDQYGIMESFAVNKGLGLILNEVATLAEPYDASAYSGIKFYHKESAGVADDSEHVVGIETPTQAYYYRFLTSYTWTELTLTWADFGVPEEEVDTILEIEWRFFQGTGIDPMQEQDTVWLDDVVFY